MMFLKNHSQFPSKFPRRDSQVVAPPPEILTMITAVRRHGGLAGGRVLLIVVTQEHSHVESQGVAQKDHAPWNFMGFMMVSLGTKHNQHQPGMKGTSPTMCLGLVLMGFDVVLICAIFPMSRNCWVKYEVPNENGYI